MVEGSLVLGHQIDSSEDVPHQETDVIAMDNEPNPGTLRKGSNPQFADRKVWRESYEEEYNGLVSMDTMEIPSTPKYKNLKNALKAIPTVCMLMVKISKTNRPVRPKFRMVVLGGYMEEREWTRSE